MSNATSKAVQPSDSLEFVPNMPVAGASQVSFCSEKDDVADVDDTFCQPSMTGQLAILEQGTETTGETTPYAPTAGQPGFGMMGTAVVTYDLISDSPKAAPEPSALSLFGSGLAGIAGRALFRRRRYI